MNNQDQSTDTLSSWNIQHLKHLFHFCDDVNITSYYFGQNNTDTVVLIHCDGICNNAEINRVVLPELEYLYEKTHFANPLAIAQHKRLPLESLTSSNLEKQVTELVFGGSLILFFQGLHCLFAMDLSDPPIRTPSESSTEISIKGPKDGFVEDLVVNIALVRKRMRSNSLCVEKFVLGRRTRTRVGLLYLKDVINPQVLQDARRRLNQIDVDGIHGVNQIEERMTRFRFALFPTLDNTGRPDYAVSSLLAGRFVLMVEGNPTVLIAPATLSLVMKSPEDVQFNYAYVSFARLVRFLSLIMSIFLPGLWIALVSYHQDQIPFNLLATIASTRIGIPLPPSMEMFMLLMLLEILREAGVRLPSSLGQTLTVVGGLIIGESAIRAGLVSPSVVVVGAITVVTGATLVNQTLSTTLSVLRLGVFLISSILGMYGLILSIFVLVSYLSKLKSFGVPYLSTLSPPTYKDVVKSVLRVPWKFLSQRPGSLNTVDSDKKKEDNS